MGRIPLSGVAVFALTLAIGSQAATAGAATSFNTKCTTEADAGTPFEVGSNCRLIDVDGYARKYIVSVPASAAAAGGRVPLVVMLHGTGGNGGKFLKISGWVEKAEAQGFVVAFPTGLVYRFNEGGQFKNVTKWNNFSLGDNIDPTVKPSGYPATAPWPADDVSFMRQLVADVGSQMQIDPDRTFIAGFSNGGQMCMRLAVEASDLFAAAGCNAGNLEAGHPTTPPSPNIPTMLTFGTLDTRLLEAIHASDPSISEVPLDPTQMLAINLVSALVNNAVDAFALDPEARVDETAPTSTKLHFETPVAGNTDGNFFDFLVLAGVKHVYPNGTNRSNNPNGFVMADIHWDFFTANARQHDTKAPKTKIEKHPDGRTPSRKVTFRFSANESGAKFECKLDNSAYKHCKSPKRYRVKLGKHTFRVRAIDSSGNVDSTPAKDKFRVVG